jgi:hypothetical protein
MQIGQMWKRAVESFQRRRCSSVTPSNPDWKEFMLPDFGTRLEYPAGIFSVRQGKSEVGTGERLSTDDARASLTIYARANESGETPASYLRRNLRMPDSAIQYRRVTPSFFAISMARQGVIYYSRCNSARECVSRAYAR